LSLDFLADVAAAYATSIGRSQSVDVIGQSHGGAVAQTLAVRRPALIRSLILPGTMGHPARQSALLKTYTETYCDKSRPMRLGIVGVQPHVVNGTFRWR
jgi:pimeloyl-ACP methyl ester carboxylesterase